MKSRPPFCAQQRGHRDRNGVGWIGVETWMRFGAHRPIFFDFQIKQQLVTVIILPKAAKRRPHQIAAIVWARSEIAIKNKLAAFPADVKLFVMRIEDLDAVLGAFRERCTMPSEFLRAIG